MKTKHETTPLNAYLQKALHDRHWTQADLAYVLQCRPSVVNYLVNRPYRLNPKLAKALAVAFRVQAKDILDIQTTHDLACAPSPDIQLQVRLHRLKEYTRVQQEMKKARGD